MAMVDMAIASERLSQLGHKLVPRFCSIYDPNFWYQERFWKFIGVQYLNAFNGTCKVSSPCLQPVS